MESLSICLSSLSICLSSSPPLQNHYKTQKSPSKSSNPFPHCKISLQIQSLPTNTAPILSHLSLKNILTPHLSCLATSLCFPLSSFAVESALPTEELPNRINLKAILTSVDDFFNKNPFFVAGVTLIWLVVIPIAEEHFRNYKFFSAIDAFRKLRDDPNCQMIDIRHKKSFGVLNSPNLKIIGKTVLHVDFQEGNEDGFVAKVLESLQEPANTSLCILGNFDGNSMKVAELLVKNGFKEVYAIRGGIRGKKGWQEIQETLLPPSVHIYPKKKTGTSEQLDVDGKKNQLNANKDQASLAGVDEDASNGYINIKGSIQPTSPARSCCRPSSPYPNYPDLKPPSSPMPSKPR